MDVINPGRQRAREEKSRDFHDRLLSTAFSASLPTIDVAPSVLSVRDKIAMEKHERFLARLDCN